MLKTTTTANTISSRRHAILRMEGTRSRRMVVICQQGPQEHQGHHDMPTYKRLDEIIDRQMSMQMVRPRDVRAIMKRKFDREYDIDLAVNQYGFVSVVVHTCKPSPIATVRRKHFAKKLNRICDFINSASLADTFVRLFQYASTRDDAVAKPLVLSLGVPLSRMSEFDIHGLLSFK